MNDDSMAQQGLHHPDVGAHLFEYPFWEPDGLHRYGFTIHAGDNPDFPRAVRLLPGAHLLGCVAAGFGDTGASPDDDDWPKFHCYVVGGRSWFRTTIPAPSIDAARQRCLAIGGLRVAGDPPPSRAQRLRCLARYFWERRPVVRLRTPVDEFLI